MAVSSFLKKTILRKHKRYMDRCFPAWFDLCTDAVYFIWQYRGKPKYTDYPLYSPFVSSAVFTIRGEPVEASLRKKWAARTGNNYQNENQPLETIFSWKCMGIWFIWMGICTHDFEINFVFDQIHCVIMPNTQLICSSGCYTCTI